MILDLISNRGVRSIYGDKALIRGTSKFCMGLLKFIFVALILLTSVYTTPYRNTVISQSTTPIEYEISFSRLLGGVSYDWANGIALDSFNSLFVTGATASVDFPTQDAYNSFLTGPQSAFITKFNQDGSLNWSTFFGGSVEEFGSEIKVDSNNDVILLGDTTSDDFPTKNPYNDTFSGGDDIFLAKFQNDGQLIWSTYFGTSSQDNSRALAINSKNEIIIAGETTSNQFPLLNAFDSNHTGTWDIFISKFSPNGQLIWSTYHGGIGDDFLPDLAIDTEDNIIIGGVTGSSDFNSTNGEFTTYGGNEDNFLSKISDNGTLLWSTFLGGSGEDRASHVAVNSINEIYITGKTSSSDFPMINGYDDTINGGQDVYLSKFSSNGDLLWSSFFGGILDDEAIGIATDQNDFPIITGQTGSTNFPQLNSFDSVFQGTSEGFVARFNPQGELNWSSYLGGNDFERGWDIVSSDSFIAIVGDTTSTDFPKTEGNAPLSYDGFITILKMKEIINSPTSSTTETSDTISTTTNTNNLSPSIDSEEDVIIQFGVTGVKLSWTLHDDNPQSFTISINGIIVHAGDWSDGEIISISLDGLEIGAHKFILFAEDLGGLSTSDEVVVTVIEAEAGTTSGDNDTRATVPIQWVYFLGMLLVLPTIKRKAQTPK